MDLFFLICRTEVDVLSGWPIRKKLTFGVVLLSVSLAILAAGGIVGSNSYRSLLRGMNRRAPETPLAISIAQKTSALVATLKPLVSTDGPHRTETKFDSTDLLSNDWLLWEFEPQLDQLAHKLQVYQSLLETNSEIHHELTNVHRELETSKRMKQTVETIRSITEDKTWLHTPELQDQVYTHVTEIDRLATEIPSFLQTGMAKFADDVRVRYRTWIISTWITSLIAVLLLLFMVKLFYSWVFKPLGQLINGSRRVAAGEFDYRIKLRSQDEMAELASAMNNMTQRFQEIRDDLDGQVKQRTTEVVRSEQLASVGFLAAGVAHEINNPLASIAWSAESLEERIGEIVSVFDNDDRDWGELVPTHEVDVIRDYLRMIQDEAFRCKEITERLLDFSRLGDVEKQMTNLTELVQSVIDMVRHVGKYKEKQIIFQASKPIYVPINPQEIKQVVLNLITNGLDSLAPGGEVNVKVRLESQNVFLIVSDNGCGMTDEVKEHLFEPFFTRRRDGQGTGLGMSISYRIVNDHGGDLDVHSDGANRGSTFTVKLPLHQKEEPEDKRNAA